MKNARGREKSWRMQKTMGVQNSGEFTESEELEKNLVSSTARQAEECRVCTRAVHDQRFFDSLGSLTNSSIYNKLGGKE
jgi:hypothetical protein